MKAARISKEAAELHAVLQTAKAERASLEVAIAELRGENAELVTRISDLLARNEEQEKLLASVLANSHSNGRAEPHALRSTEGAATRLGAATENPAYVPGRNPGRLSRAARIVDADMFVCRYPGVWPRALGGLRLFWLRATDIPGFCQSGW